MEEPLPPSPPPPDVMNDPQYATNTEEGEDGNADADTCRICRGEGNDSEPLFHPCKCSGSIKHVHQDCLMEWLSHSQKKHCELCKTPFRFTKLYSPNMPQSLPFHVLIRHIIIHTAKNLATWVRFCLVIVVWLGCLPFIIRQVWRLLFWFSDGGWPSEYLQSLDHNSTAAQALEVARELHLRSLAGDATSPATPLQAAQTSSASLGRIMDKLVSFLIPVAQNLNISASDPVTPSLFKAMYYGLGTPGVLPEGPGVNSTALKQTRTLHLTSTLLSDVQFLKNLTRNSHINRLVIAVAEGYIITILVVVCFILIFLIREWVVQQQPGINMGAGFNADFVIPDRPRDQPGVPDARRHGVPPRVEAPEPRDIGQRPMARPRRRNIHFGDLDEGLQRRLPRNNLPHGEAGDAQLDSGNLTAQNRPSTGRDALSPAAEIQRRLTEGPTMTEEFLSIWRRAEGDPQEVLRIIESEDKGDQMRYWVNSMKVLQSPPSQDASAHGTLDQSILSKPTQSSTGVLPIRSHVTNSDGIAHMQAEADVIDEGSFGSESWIDIPESSTIKKPDDSVIQDSEILSDGTASPSDKGKGKERARDDIYEKASNTKPTQHDETRYRLPRNPLVTIGTSNTSSGTSSSRPRAVSDSPQPSHGISALGSNNWSFGNLPEQEEQTGLKNLWGYEDNKEEMSSKADLPLSRTVPPPSELTSPASYTNAEHVWKAAQDLRVQKAFARHREPHNTMPHNEASTITPSPSTDIPNTQEEIPFQFKAGDRRAHSVLNWADETENASTPDSGSDIDDHEHHDQPSLDEAAIINTPAEVPEPVVVIPVEPRGLLGNVADFLWGGVGEGVLHDEPGNNDEHIVQDLAAEAPFVPVAPHEGFDRDAGLPLQDREVVEAAIAAGLDPNDPDAMDDAEDFEGIMELVGMRGPIFSLFQNALFSAFLLALTVSFGVWIPYNIGRVSLLLIANPGPACKLPLRLIFGFAALIQDFALSLLGLVSYCLVILSSAPFWLWRFWLPNANGNISLKGAKFASTALHISQDALDRIMDGTVSSFLNITDSEIFAFSAASHEALINIKSIIVSTTSGIADFAVYFFLGHFSIARAEIPAITTKILQSVTHAIDTIPSVLVKPDTWVISLEIGKRSTPLDLEMSIWGGMDRFWAILAGYTALCVLGALYVRKGTPFSSGQVGREWEATIIDLLNQAGGVMKVILIISIEMLVFPLYCGLLLDVALLPLFDNATIISRLLFTMKSPLTSIFVHWFVGTCYMFHFALFVSMCRKIMRKGVLYFIRDPDDPTFHPVRDVLERNVATQLRKILFSALVYGALVIICLGGVVWGLSFAFRGVLPIHWSSNEPVLEFPIDLLFYNFLMPLAVKFFKPSDGLHSMYSWWFRQCARLLRLTWFMFDERKPDEEGYSVRRTWSGVLRGLKGDPDNFVETDDADFPFKEDPVLEVYFRRDGRYVRAPASDQVRIPKGTRIFLDVDSDNNRLDEHWDSPDGVHGRTNALYKHLYIPPWFRVRICIFIFSIWIFAALTGVSITIVPLVFGRFVFAKIIPPHVRKNDVYAFSIGVYILGSALYAILHTRRFFSYLKTTLRINAETPYNLFRRANSIMLQVLRILWTYSALFLILPTLFTFLIELYFIIPLHTYFALDERHVVHFVQSWTLGLLYVKLTTRIILWHEDSRPAQSLRAITRNGYLNPDARLATRSFILPVGMTLVLALLWPWAFARLATTTIFRNNPEIHTLAYRYAYPMCLALGGIGVALYMLVGLLQEWRLLIRDEVYLIGERLHNFGDRKSTVVAPPSLRRIDT